jgi:hypothetical protein
VGVVRIHSPEEDHQAGTYWEAYHNQSKDHNKDLLDSVQEDNLDVDEAVNTPDIHRMDQEAWSSCHPCLLVYLPPSYFVSAGHPVRVPA